MLKGKGADELVATAVLEVMFALSVEVEEKSDTGPVILTDE